MLAVTTTCSRNARSRSRGNALQPRGNPGIAGNFRLSAQRDRAALSSVGLASVQIMPAHTVRRLPEPLPAPLMLASHAVERRQQPEHLQQSWRPPCPSASEVLTRTRRHRSRLPLIATTRQSTRPQHPSQARGLAVSSLAPAGQAQSTTRQTISLRDTHANSIEPAFEASSSPSRLDQHAHQEQMLFNRYYSKREDSLGHEALYM